MVLIRDEHRMTDDAILAGLQTAMRKLHGWDGYLDDDGAGRAEALIERAREALALTRLTNLISPGLPLAPCPTCSLRPDQIIGCTAQELDATLASEGFRRMVRGPIESITLDCGHELAGGLLGQWVQAATVMREQTPGYWRGQVERVEKDRLDDAERDAARIEKLKRKLRKARKQLKAARPVLLDVSRDPQQHPGDETGRYVQGGSE